MTTTLLTPTDEELDDLARRVSNRGRWGPDDELGTLNFLTPERRARAAAEIRTGAVVSLAHPLPLGTTRLEQSVHTVWRVHEPFQYASELIAMAFHGAAVTHLDALCHMHREGRMYNGYPASEVTPRGSRRCSVEQMSANCAGRGILLDMARLRGVDRLPGGLALTPDDLDAAERRQGVRVESGDLLFVRVGGRPERAAEGNAGLTPECAVWLREREAALLGTDVGTDVNPGRPGRWGLLMHQLLIAEIGMPLVDNAALDELGAACERLGRSSFFVVLAPLRIEGGTGAPVNPQAIF
jgi:kynurenine formamidase